MNPQELDKLIDTATREMISGDPPRALSHRVMSEALGSIEPAPRRWVWAVRTACAVVLCAVVATFVVSRGPLPAPETAGPESRTRPMSVPTAMPQARAGEAPVTLADTQPATRDVTERSPARPPVAPLASARDVEVELSPSVEPLAVEPIVVSTLDLPTLENQATTIEDIEISDITIEPLAASND